VEAIRGGSPPEVDLYAALDFSLPGLVSQESVLRGSVPLPVPDFRGITQFPEGLPAELRAAHVLRLATEDGQPTWR